MSRSLVLVALGIVVAYLTTILQPEPGPRPLPPGEYRVVIDEDLDVGFTVDAEGMASLWLVTPPADVRFLAEEGWVLDQLEVMVPDTRYQVQIAPNERGTYNVLVEESALDG